MGWTKHQFDISTCSRNPNSSAAGGTVQSIGVPRPSLTGSMKLHSVPLDRPSKQRYFRSQEIPVSKCAQICTQSWPFYSIHSGSNVGPHWPASWLPCRFRFTFSSIVHTVAAAADLLILYYDMCPV